MEALAAELVDWSIPQPDKTKILIVDDEIPLLLLLEETLLNAGYKVISEENAANAVNLALCMQPDIILLDVVMPGVDGFTICKQLQQNRQTRHIPVIFLTIDNLVDRKVEGLKVGGVDYLIKPWDSGELLARIQRHIEINWHRRSLEKTVNDKNNQLQDLKSQFKKSKKFPIKSDLPYQKILSILDAGVVRVDKNFYCISANDSAAYLLDYNDPNEMIGKKVLSKDKNKASRKNDLKIENNKFIKVVNNRDNYFLTKNNKIKSIEMSLTPVFDKENGESADIVFTDISMEKSLQQEFSSLIYKDALTGLLNKSAFNGVIQSVSHEANKQENQYTVFIIDLDYFKEVNDSFGHLVGDQVLCEIAERLCRFVRKQDKVARLGGDEFGMLIDGAKDNNDIERQAARLIDVIRQPIKLPDVSISSSACIGIAVLNEMVLDGDDVVSRADMALYAAKRQRGKGYCLFHEAMLDEFKDGMMLEKELSSLIKNNQLYVEYQPQFLMTGEYIGAEALVRWNHPVKGKLLPINFLPIAEKRGFLRHISNHALMKVCEQIGEWKVAGVNFGRISVNVCAAQLNDIDVFNQISRLLEKHNVAPADLILELTEDTLFNISQETKSRLLQLIELGIKFAIDDFGKGYSSMQLLKDMHSDIMKIDKSFVEGIEYSEKSRIIIKAIIDLSKDLDMYVVAEGVENVNQLNFLREVGCDSFQGFYLRKSVDPKTLEEDFFGD